jgi:hypothetical protein
MALQVRNLDLTVISGNETYLKRYIFSSLGIAADPRNRMSDPSPSFRSSILINAEEYEICIYDAEPGGVIVIAKNMNSETKYKRAFSKVELNAASLSKCPEGFVTLANSLHLVPSLTKELQLHSTLPGCHAPEAIATGHATEKYLTTVQSGSEKFTDVLSRGLIFLCKEKPMGINAVALLGKWLLENNPNQPTVTFHK